MSAGPSTARRGFRVAVSLALVTVVGASLFTGTMQRLLVTAGVPVPGWCTLTTADGREAFPQMQMTALANRIVMNDADVSRSYRDALGTPESLTCVVTETPDLREEAPSATTGLTSRATAVMERVTELFGPIPSGGYSPEGITSGRIPGSAHYDGRAIDYFFTPYDDPATKREGWTLANWLVAHAGDLHVYAVIYDDRIWTSARSLQGWREYVHPSGDTANPVLRHLDHVHVDVRRGQ